MAFGPMVNWNSHLLQLLGPDWKSTHRNVGSNKFFARRLIQHIETPHTHGDQISVPAPVTSRTNGNQSPLRVFVIACYATTAAYSGLIRFFHIPYDPIVPLSEPHGHRSNLWPAFKSFGYIYIFAWAIHNHRAHCSALNDEFRAREEKWSRRQSVCVCVC